MGESIQEMFNKFKYLIKDDTFFYSGVVVLVAIVCFGLGRWSGEESLKNAQINGLGGVKMVQEASLPRSEAKEVGTTSPKSTGVETVPEKKYVGSKSGTKYHLLTCPGAKTIKEVNKIYFSSKEDAQKNGYLPAGNCKGI